MDDRLQRVEAKIEKSGADVRRLTMILSLFMLTLIGLVVAAAMVTDIFKVDYNGTTRFQVDQQGTTTINADTNAADVALRILSAPNSRGDIRFSTRSSDPTSPQVGDLWFNSTEGKFKIYDGFKRTMSFDGLTQIVDDATANNNNGTRGANSNAASDDPTWTTDAKLGGCALSFDGGDFARFGDVLDNVFTGANATFSIEAWVRPNVAMVNNLIVAKIADSSFSENQRQWFMGLYAGSLSRFRWYGALDGSSYREATGSTAITNTSKWYHVVVVYDGTLAVDSRVSLFVDGVAEATSIGSSGSPSTIPDGTAQLGIGAIVNTAGTASSGNFNGMIDEVAIWNVALTPAQIAARWNGGAGAELAGNESGLVSVWHLNDPK